MDLHRGQASARGGEASHGQHESWICTGDQASAIRGSEASHGQYPANRRRTGRCGADRRSCPRPTPLLQQEARTPHSVVSRQQAPNRATQRETPPRPRHTEASRDTWPTPSVHPSNSYRGPRRFNRAVTHPSTTAGRDDLTPLLYNIWSATIRSLPA
jgi:hypothetical protein